MEGGAPGLAHGVNCNAAEKSQLWDFVNSANPKVSASTRLRNRKSGLCLHFDKDDNIVMNPCTDACDQRWVVAAIGGPLQETHLKSFAPAPVYQAMHKEIRIFCWIQTQPSAHQTLVVAINNTWGRDCTYLLFVSTAPHSGVNMLVTETGVVESRITLYAKTQQAWIHGAH